MKRFALFLHTVQLTSQQGIKVTFETISAPLEHTAWIFEGESIEEVKQKFLKITEALQTQLEITVGGKKYPKFYLAEIADDASNLTVENANNYIPGNFHPITSS